MDLIRPYLTRLSRIFGYVTIFGLVAGAIPTVAWAAPPSPLDPVSPGASSIANLHNTILVIATLVFLIVSGLLIYSLVRFRRRSPDEPEPDQSFHGSAVLETIWTVIPVGILIVILVLTFQTLQETNPDRPTEMTVRVIGKQWLWEVQYPEHNIRTTGELRIPVDTDVRVELTSEDVIHSFWVPQLGGKQDAVPGYLTTTWFKADQEGTFRGHCAEYCGLGHADMPIEVIAMERASFDTWAATTAEQQANASAQGELLFSTNCASCHAIEGEGGQIGPDLTTVIAEEGEEYVHESIIRPNAVITPQCPTGPCPSGVMPQNFEEQLSDQELDSIISYLKETSGIEE
jgi:cytochrome c oxidase subunit 2